MKVTRKRLQQIIQEEVARLKKYWQGQESLMWARAYGQADRWQPEGLQQEGWYDGPDEELDYEVELPGMPRAFTDPAFGEKPWGSYSSVHGGTWSDVLVMSPNADSILVAGNETYPENVPRELQYRVSRDFDEDDIPPMPDDMAQALVKRLRDAVDNVAYVEVGVSYSDQDGWRVS